MSGAQQSNTRRDRRESILVINCGSSSVKFGLFGASPSLSRFWSGAVDRIGFANAHLHVVDTDGRTVVNKTGQIPDQEAGIALLLETLEQRADGPSLVAVGHRVVHGGPDCDCPVVINRSIEARLKRLIPLAPLHQPHNLAGIAAIRKVRPQILQVACFDTAFHHHLSRVTKLTGLPQSFFDEGVRRYGFHGLSYEFIVDALRSDGVDVERERIIIAHLGNGASMCAIQAGRSVETTMGFSTLAGLPMGTRCGDLDPGIVLYLLTEKGITAEAVQHLLYEKSGLLGLSGVSANMQDLLAQPANPAAVETIEFFCYQARRQLAALTAALGGLDRLVFTAGIGVHAALVREKICDGLEYLGIKLDSARNTTNERMISSDSSNVIVDVFDTDEELMIARHVYRILTEQRSAPREVQR